MLEGGLNKAGGDAQSKMKNELGRGNPWAVLVVFLLVVCLFEAVLLFKSFRLRHQESVAPPGAKVNQPEPYFAGHAGPWGNIEYAPIALEPPDEFIPTNGNVFGPTRWFFQGYDSATLKDFLSQCGLTVEQFNKLTRVAIWKDAPDGVFVMPDDELVLDLAEPARQKIYSALAKSQVNTLHLWPFKARTNDLDTWLGRAGLSEKTVGMLRKLVYHRGEYLCFSDINVVYPRIVDAEERRNFIKRLARTPSLLMKLSVRPDSKVDELADYWAKGRRSKDIAALLDSLTEIPGGMTIDVAHLLPPFARKRLYTFPVPPADPQATWPNCNWTAMNFFNDSTDNRYYDLDFCGDALQQNYTKTRQATFGDLIVFYRPDGFPIHMVVYIADDIVFTKNGSSTFHPWMLMKWDDLIADYTLDYSPVYIIFHPKRQMEQ